MFEKRKIKKEAKEIAKQAAITAQAQEIAKNMVPNQANSNNHPEGETRTVDNSMLSQMFSLKNDIRDNLMWILLGIMLLAVSYEVVGLEFTLTAFVIMGVIVYVYTSKFYHVPLQSVLLLKIPQDQPVQIRFVSFPYRIFQFVNTVGMTNAVFTPDRGTIFLANDIIYGDNGYPTAIKFSWIHFPEYSFIMKKEVYAILVEYVNRLILINSKLNELMDLNTYAIASEITENRIKRIGEGKMANVMKLQAEQQELQKKIAQLVHDNDIIENKSQANEEATANA